MADKESTSLEIGNLKTELAIIPIGATEQHAHHLPVMTDAFIAEKVCAEAAKRIQAYLLPVQPFGTSIENMDGPGTVTLRPLTLRSVLNDLVDSLYQQGYKKIFVINFHGGNFILKPAIREINYDRKEGTVFYLDPWDALFAPEDLHAGFAETALMLYLWKGDLKYKNLKAVKPARHKRSDLDWIGMVGATKGAGYWGDPSRATQADGKRIFEQLVTATLSEIQRLLNVHMRKPGKS